MNRYILLCVSLKNMLFISEAMLILGEAFNERDGWFEDGVPGDGQRFLKMGGGGFGFIQTIY